MAESYPEPKSGETDTEHAQVRPLLAQPAATPEPQRVAEAPQAARITKISSAPSEMLACWFHLRRWGGWWGGRKIWLDFHRKTRGAAGITTAAPRIAGQWGRGITGCRNDAQALGSFQPDPAFLQIFSRPVFVP
jgi:hypothetical protein